MVNKNPQKLMKAAAQHATNERDSERRVYTDPVTQTLRRTEEPFLCWFVCVNDTMLPG